jgi:hypothetical protein
MTDMGSLVRIDIRMLDDYLACVFGFGDSAKPLPADARCQFNGEIAPIEMKV